MRVSCLLDGFIGMSNDPCPRLGIHESGRFSHTRRELNLAQITPRLTGETVLEFVVTLFTDPFKNAGADPQDTAPLERERMLAAMELLDQAVDQFS